MAGEYFVSRDEHGWRLTDAEGGIFGTFGGEQPALNAARYLAQEHPPARVFCRSESGEWELRITIEDPSDPVACRS